MVNNQYYSGGGGGVGKAVNLSNPARQNILKYHVMLTSSAL